MASPEVITRVDPSAAPDSYRYLTNGCISTIAFSADPNAPLFEIAVTPPGIDNGDEIDTTTMWNDTCRTKIGRCFDDWTPASMRVAYDPEFYSIYNNLLSQNQAITISFPNGDNLTFWGYMKSFIPSEMEDGVFPEADVEIVVSNWDHVNCVEACPVFQEATGTC